MDAQLGGLKLFYFSLFMQRRLSNWQPFFIGPTFFLGFLPVIYDLKDPEEIGHQKTLHLALSANCFKVKPLCINALPSFFFNPKICFIHFFVNLLFLPIALVSFLFSIFWNVSLFFFYTVHTFEKQNPPQTVQYLVMNLLSIIIIYAMHY